MIMEKFQIIYLRYKEITSYGNESIILHDEREED
jgi:hypothetical protein